MTKTKPVAKKAAPKASADLNTEAHQADPIEEVVAGECPSLSGASTLTYAIGKHKTEGSLHLRLVSNTGGGLFCKDWVDAKAIDALLKSGKPLTSRATQALLAGRSINSGGFLLAVLKHLGLVRLDELNARHHQAVPGMTFTGHALR